jgi:hypothetical protein
MPYLLIEDGFADNPKITGLSHQAYRLHTLALVMSAKNMTNGSISEISLRWTSNLAQIGRPKRYVSELIRAGLWELAPDGWRIHDYLVHNPSRAEMEEKRRNARERKRRHDNRRNASSNALRNASENASGNASKDPPQGVLRTPPGGASPTGSPGTSSRHHAALAEAERTAATWTTPDSEAFALALDELQLEHGITLRPLDRERLWDTAWRSSANGAASPTADVARLAGRSSEPPPPLTTPGTTGTIHGRPLEVRPKPGGTGADHGGTHDE